ncbi:MAG: FAD-dependent oxidoreductase, partial [Limnohabitans sp.]
LTGVETRTSSPLRIPRGDDFQSLNTPGLYPAGEGASYAGGILSAGVDGIKVAEALALACVAAR